MRQTNAYGAVHILGGVTHTFRFLASSLAGLEMERDSVLGSVTPIVLPVPDLLRTRETSELIEVR